MKHSNELNELLLLLLLPCAYLDRQVEPALDCATTIHLCRLCTLSAFYFWSQCYSFLYFFSIGHICRDPSDLFSVTSLFSEPLVWCRYVSACVCNGGVFLRCTALRLIYPGSTALIFEHISTDQPHSTAALCECVPTAWLLCLWGQHCRAEISNLWAARFKVRS